MKSFQDKVVLVTGGTSGIGRATAVAFAREGAKVVVSGRRETEGAETVKLIHAAGGEGRFIKADVAKEADIAALVAGTVEAYGRLDVAVNNAGVELTGAIVDAKEEDYRRIFDINVWGVLASMKHQVPALLKNGGGAIVNTSSVAGKIGMAGASIYIASKHAVEGLTRTAALEFAKQNIRVNAVAPAVIVTDMFNRFAGGESSDAANYMKTLHPVGRFGQPEEVAAAILWLASDQASFVTGQSLSIDGGFTAQ
jgi:NAD(P)-dependent dehydrogenase (short-subunit alcohol dehydrogenase family)